MKSRTELLPSSEEITGLFLSGKKGCIGCVRWRNYVQRGTSWKEMLNPSQHLGKSARQDSLDQEELPSCNARAFDPESQFTSTFSWIECLRVPHWLQWRNFQVE